MFMLHISFLLTFCVLLASAVLFIWSLRNEGNGILFGKVVGATIFILSLLVFLGLSFFGLQHWKSEMLMSKEMALKMRKDVSEELKARILQKLKEHKESREKTEESSPPSVPKSVEK